MLKLKNHINRFMIIRWINCFFYSNMIVEPEFWIVPTNKTYSPNKNLKRKTNYSQYDNKYIHNIYFSVLTESFIDCFIKNVKL